MLLLRTCFFAFFLATLPVALLHAQTAPPQSDSLPKVGFAIIKTSQVAVAQALLVPGGSVTQQVDSNFSAFLIKHHDDYLLFDTGMGTSKLFGPTTGKLLASLKAAGIQPGQIDDVICSHAHIDHIGGLADAKGRRFFPNATVHISKTDHDFWTDEKNIGPGASKEFVAHARQNLMPYKNRIKFIEDGKDVISGVQAMSVPGHTMGHTIFIIKSGAKSLVYTADITHHQILLTEKPRTEFAYDTDPKLAVQSRLKTFDMIASQKLPMLAYHFPWPGYGHLAKQGDGFRYYPEPMEFVPIPPKKA